MKYLKRETVVNAFKINEENLPDIVKELLGNKYVEDISIGKLDNLYLTLTLTCIGENGYRYTHTMCSKHNIFIIFEENEAPKFMTDKDFYNKYEEINEQGAVLI